VSELSKHRDARDPPGPFAGRILDPRIPGTLQARAGGRLPSARLGLGSGACRYLQCFWQVLVELIVTVAVAVAEPLAPVQVTE